MPTDIAEAIARKRKARKDAKNDIILLAAFLLIYFANLVLVPGRRSRCTSNRANRPVLRWRSIRFDPELFALFLFSFPWQIASSISSAMRRAGATTLAS
jgi:hypothetical protein